MRRAVVLVFLLTSHVASAHQTGVKYLELRVEGSELAIGFRVSPGDVTEPMRLAADAVPASRDAAAAAAVAPYAARWLAVSSAGEPCTPGTPTASVDRDPRFVVIAWRVACAGTIDDLDLDFTGFFAVDRRHVAIVHLEAADSEPVDLTVDATAPTRRLHAGDQPGSSLAWLRVGMTRHYAGGAWLVLALLAIIPLVRVDRSWRVRALAPAMRNAGAIAVGFGAAHAIAVVAASHGWVSIRGDVAAAMIAGSIVYASIEDVVVPGARWRSALAFGFGLVHGVDPLPAGAPLVAVELGVIVCELAVALVALPVLYIVASVVGGERYRRLVLPIVATVACVAAVYGFVQRVM